MASSTTFLKASPVVWPCSTRHWEARAFEAGVQTSTFGVGTDFDAALMSDIAERGAGGYYYLADAAQISVAIGRELDARLRPVAQAIEIRVRLRPDVVPSKLYGSRALDAAEALAVRAQEVAVDQHVKARDGIAADRGHDAEGGMRFFIPAFARGDHHSILLKVTAPKGLGKRPLGSVEIRYKDRLRKKNVTEELPLRIEYARDEAASALTINEGVQRAIQSFAAGDAILRAASFVDNGDRASAARLLEERIALLRQAAGTMAEPTLLPHAQRLARLVHAVQGDKPIQDLLPLAVLLRGAGHGYLQ